MTIARYKSFLLRLPLSQHESASEFAKAEGISLNRFISLAVAHYFTWMEDLQEKRTVAKVRSDRRNAL